ncbi:MAG: exonuclease domain-containing protein [Methylacidiphilales bacterium]|nr:exonuclease domain-containing protein [Candidatus Methylacidiphilales bacterium]
MAFVKGNISKRLISLDLETTGLSVTQDRIIEIGLLEILDSSISGDFKLIRVNPGIPIPPDSSAIHGIYDNDIKDKPLLSEILTTVIEYIDSSPIIMHNAEYDRNLFINELERIHPDYAQNFKKLEYIDTLQLCRRKFPNQKNDLSSVCARLGIPTHSRDKTGLHNAYDDARLAAQVYIFLQTNPEQLSIELDSNTSNSFSISEAQVSFEISPFKVPLTHEMVTLHEDFRNELKKYYNSDLELNRHLPIGSIESLISKE